MPPKEHNLCPATLHVPLPEWRCRLFRVAPAVGFEPTTNRLTADRSTTELRWIKLSFRAAYVLITSS